MPSQSIRIPHDSNLRCLPLVYLLPDELMARCPTLMKIPRNPYQVLQSNEWLDLIDSDQFLDEIRSPRPMFSKYSNGMTAAPL